MTGIIAATMQTAPIPVSTFSRTLLNGVRVLTARSAALT